MHHVSIAGGGMFGFILFPMILVLGEMQTASSMF